MNNNKEKMMMIGAMTIFGTIGIFRKYIPLPSSLLALARGIIGTAFLLFLVLVVKRDKLSIEAIKRNFVFLVVSGAFIGFNWILLFLPISIPPLQPQLYVTIWRQLSWCWSRRFCLKSG